MTTIGASNLFDVAEVQREADRIDYRRVLLTLLFLAPFALGWLCGALLQAAAWAASAAAVGYRRSRPAAEIPAA